jgi:hypothetical protein
MAVRSPRSVRSPAPAAVGGHPPPRGDVRALTRSEILDAGGRLGPLRIALPGRDAGGDATDLLAEFWEIVGGAHPRLVQAGAAALAERGTTVEPEAEAVETDPVVAEEPELETEPPAVVAEEPEPHVEPEPERELVDAALAAAMWGLPSPREHDDRTTSRRSAAAPRRRHRPHHGPVPGERMALAFMLSIALCAGLAWALPLRDVAQRCPKHGEAGYVQCVMQKAWLPSIVEVIGVVVVAFILHQLIFRTLPAVRARWHSGERLVRMTRSQERPPYESDPVLLAATWGVKTGRGAP